MVDRLILDFHSERLWSAQTTNTCFPRLTIFCWFSLMRARFSSIFCYDNCLKELADFWLTKNDLTCIRDEFCTFIGLVGLNVARYSAYCYSKALIVWASVNFANNHRYTAHPHHPVGIFFGYPVYSFLGDPWHEKLLAFLLKVALPRQAPMHQAHRGQLLKRSSAKNAHVVGNEVPPSKQKRVMLHWAPLLRQKSSLRDASCGLLLASQMLHAYAGPLHMICRKVVAQRAMCATLKMHVLKSAPGRTPCSRLGPASGAPQPLPVIP